MPSIVFCRQCDNSIVILCCIGNYYMIKIQKMPVIVSYLDNILFLEDDK